MSSKENKSDHKKKKRKKSCSPNSRSKDDNNSKLLLKSFSRFFLWSQHRHFSHEKFRFACKLVSDRDLLGILHVWP